MPYTEVDLPKWVNIDHLMNVSAEDINAMVNSANADLDAFKARLSLLGLNKKPTHVVPPPAPPSAHRASAAPSGGGGGGGGAPSVIDLGADRALAEQQRRHFAEQQRLREIAEQRRREAAEQQRRREAEQQRRREAEQQRRDRELAEATEAAEIAEAEERRQRNAREIGVQLVGSRHLDANSDLANRQVDMRRIAQQLAVQEQRNGHVVNMIAMPPGSLGGQVIVHHHGGGGAPIAVGINGVPRAVFGPPMINPFPFGMPGFGARRF
jgi:hypothetical protein